MKFKEGDAVATSIRGTALLAQKEPAFGVIVRALEAGDPNNWFGDREPEYMVRFSDLPKRTGDLKIIMKEAELELADLSELARNVAVAEEQK